MVYDRQRAVRAISHPKNLDMIYVSKVMIGKSGRCNSYDMAWLSVIMELCNQHTVTSLRQGG